MTPEIYWEGVVLLHCPPGLLRLTSGRAAPTGNFVLNFLSGVFSVPHPRTTGFYRVTLAWCGLTERCSASTEEPALPNRPAGWPQGKRGFEPH